MTEQCGGGDAPGPIDAFLADLHASLAGLTDGAPASYIPELAKADPALFGIAIATVDGGFHVAGDWDAPFTIQSISKAFVYAHALETHGRAAVLRKVGVEPSGDSFNSITFDIAHKRPYNPMVNAGAIATAELIEGADPAERRATLDRLMAGFAGHTLPLDAATYESERETGHRNRAIAWLMLSAGMIERDPEEVLDLYFRQCSLQVTARDLAVMGATLANDGVNPITGDRALAADCVPDVLTVMNSCGMYNYAGQWAYEIGLPAKSGVSGAILAVIPGQAGIAIFSPPIDVNGNSVRGVEACRRIAEAFGLHLFRTHPDPRHVIRAEFDGGEVRSKRARPLGDLEVLTREGRRIRVIDAQDALFFGSTERLLRRAGELAREADWLILDVRRVVSADAAAGTLLTRFHETMRAQCDHVLFAHLLPDGPLAGLHAHLAAALGDLSGTVFPTRDAALEYCEDALIAASAPGRARSPEPAFEDFELFRGIDASGIAKLRALARPVRAAEGEAFIREGGSGDAFFVLASGSASICSTIESASGPRPLRLSAIGPGTGFGERALIDGGPRLADVIADGEATAFAFPVDRVRALAATDPDILIALLGNMAGDLSERLAIANVEIRALEG